VLVIPAGSALIELKHQVDAGTFPGVTDFFSFAFADDLHVSTPSAYLVALVFYSCFYKQSPEGRVTTADTGLTDAQARAIQRIAWDTVRKYPLSGVASP
jgi:hypothetical protein